MSELEFLNALHVDLLRHDGISVARSPHELWTASSAARTCSRKTPYAVVVPFTPAPEQRVCGPIGAAALESRLWRDRDRPRAPTAIRIDGRF